MMFLLVGVSLAVKTESSLPADFLPVIDDMQKQLATLLLVTLQSDSFFSTNSHIGQYRNIGCYKQKFS